MSIQRPPPSVDSDAGWRNTKEIAVKIVIASLVIGPLMLSGAVVAFADSPAFSIGSEHSVQLAASGDATGDRDSFVQGARKKTAEWQLKLQALNDKAEANGKAAADTAQDDLHKAWVKVESASHQLETASGDGWNDAKTAFDTASGELTDAWHKRFPDKK
jgi:hypothetical protein